MPNREGASVLNRAKYLKYCQQQRQEVAAADAAKVFPRATTTHNSKQASTSHGLAQQKCERFFALSTDTQVAPWAHASYDSRRLTGTAVAACACYSRWSTASTTAVFCDRSVGRRKTKTLSQPGGSRSPTLVQPTSTGCRQPVGVAARQPTG